MRVNFPGFRIETWGTQVDGWARAPSYASHPPEESLSLPGAALFQLSIQRIPGDSVMPVLIERFEAAVKLCLLSRGQGELFGLKAIPQLRNQGQTLRRGEARKLVLIEGIHGSKGTTNRGGAQVRHALESGANERCAYGT